MSKSTSRLPGRTQRPTNTSDPHEDARKIIVVAEELGKKRGEGEKKLAAQLADAELRLKESEIELKTLELKERKQSRWRKFAIAAAPIILAQGVALWGMAQSRDAELKLMEARKESIEREIKELERLKKGEADQMKELQAEIFGLTKKLGDARMELESAERVRDLAKADTDLERSKFHDLRRDYEKLERDRSALRIGLEANQRQVFALSDEVGSLTDKLRRLAENYEGSKIHIGRLTNFLASSIGQLRTIQNQLPEHQGEMLRALVTQARQVIEIETQGISEKLGESSEPGKETSIEAPRKQTASPPRNVRLELPKRNE